MFGGRERTEAQFEALLAGAGWALERVGRLRAAPGFVVARAV